jgi:hypothetical protein
MKLNGPTPLVLIALLLTWAKPAQSQITPVEGAHITDGDFVYGVAVSGNYAYVAHDTNGLRVYDVSNPVKPIRVGQTNDGRLALSVAVSGNQVFLANDTDGLRIYDISEPQRPINVGHGTNLPASHAMWVTVSGNCAFEANYIGGMRIYDISAPTNPIVVCQFTTNNGAFPNSGYAVHVAASGHYAYLANTMDGLRIYDVTDPANPVNISHTNDGGIAYAVAVSGYYACLANGGDGLRIYSLGFPATPPLGIAITTTNTALLSWPAPSPAFVVQRNADLGAGSWVDVSNSQTVVAGRNEVVLPLAAGSRFYHLKSP